MFDSSEQKQSSSNVLDPFSLLKMAPNIVKTRKGSVLVRNTILKMDHFPSGTSTNLDFHLQGAPNFRVAELNVHGVAQPTVIGLSTILAVLNCHPKSLNSVSCTWFSTREEPLVYLNGIPYVLRDYANPMQNMSTFLGINSVRLEKVEERLKLDVLKEAGSLGGLLLVHQELPDRTVIPCYIAADQVQTPKEVFESFQAKGYRLKYFRIPISPEQAPEDNYFDEYINVIRSLEPDDPLIFNCGIGAVRTTVGIIIAQIIRRAQLIERGKPDPFLIPGWNYFNYSAANSSLENSPSLPDEVNINPFVVKSLEDADNVNAKNNALLRVILLLQNVLDTKLSSKSAIEWALEEGSLIENLKEAIMGNYQSIIALTTVIEHGIFSKKILDTVIDRSDAVVNLRESILTNRIRHTMQTADYKNNHYNKSSSNSNNSNSNGKNMHYLNKALAGLQRYFFLLCFTAYINESPNIKLKSQRFSSWVRCRPEIWAMLQNMRRKGPRFYFFRPVDDLHFLLSGRQHQDTKMREGFGYDDDNTMSGPKGHHTVTHRGMFDMTGAGSQTTSGISTEMEEFVINSRIGVVLTSHTILKVDFWHYGYLIDNREDTHGSEKTDMDHDNNHHISNHNQPQSPIVERHHNFVIIDGASNFRRIDNTNVYGVAQPTINGLRQVIRSLFINNKQQANPCERILWINLREEPIIYINGIPYVLRDRAFTLRNLRAYKGITGHRMEQLEERLKEDVIREVMQCGGYILLHGEDSNGNVLSSWEEVDIEDIMTVRQVMEFAATEIQQELQQMDVSLSSSSDDDDTHLQRQKQKPVSSLKEGSLLLEYHRVPITAEKAPERRDFDDLTSLITGVNLSKTAIVMNCQVGLGRSTTGTIIASLLTRWMKPSNITITSTHNDLFHKKQYPNYQLINSLLRVIRRGLENKGIVDNIIDLCSVGGSNLRNTIEFARIQAEKEEDPTQFRRVVKRGIVSLERYFMFICFQAYLDSTSSKNMLCETESFSRWMKRHPELDTILQDLLHAAKKDEDEFRALVPVEQSSMIGDGMALSSEVMQVVNSRHGQVLALQTILKHDAFPGCQKMSLKEKIPGAYNFRRVEVSQVKQSVKYGSLAATIGGLAADLMECEKDGQVKSSLTLTPPFIAGCAMPNKDAVKSILKAMKAGPGGSRWVYWTCLREEPVIYVNKNPYVLRLFMDPLKNLETTGISKERVESMEDRMKLDIIQELNEYKGRILLHDEDNEFNLLPMWETVPEHLVETPSQVFESIRSEGYQVNYMRIPITDEQAPIPDVFDQLIHRMAEVNQGADVIFNCQMGRGRTTTGMVVASLVSMILSNDAIVNMTDSFIVDNSIALGTTNTNIIHPFNNNNCNDDESHEERERYENGEYRVILQLVSVLTYGKLAKRLTDQAINMFDHMQNLRKAIYDYKLRIEAMTDQGSKKWRATREVALNYLVRYFYLIVFANYLLEEMSNGFPSIITEDDNQFDKNEYHHQNDTQNINAFEEARKLITFKEWLKGRREIVNIISLQTLDLY
ncbi:inositol hexakisphosphate-domain-containing protein [Cokeromyces recurvatus]|uniref:inositol hexakisphosphate-domain-containing protein n=1 Tax=Cokeromyces recurvatus TaxID=90255 RepID=UPI00221EEA16|nr:inositol hexakisphosphate-domain-containing protein [Cokeromyces recurvatus]KAI7904707.1 inositol hexakisphosphate-domain-containing protein [Cokeromyces recurvatus]